jgi:hypothetical protein
VALTGSADFFDSGLEFLGRVTVNSDAPEQNGRRLRWGTDVRAGDLLMDRGHWIVLMSDDGDGALGPDDRVTHSWRRPAVVTTLEAALRDDAVEAELVRHGG